jgi:hypothetical protein
MKIKIDGDLMTICKQIVNYKHTEDEWAGMESGDMFQIGRYNGGFDADDMFFAFSFEEKGEEWCFSLNLEEVQDIAEQTKIDVNVDKWIDLYNALEDD